MHGDLCKHLGIDSSTDHPIIYQCDKWFIEIFYLPFQDGTSLVDLLCFFCLVFVMPLFVCLFV